MFRRSLSIRMPLTAHRCMLWLAVVAFVCRAFMPIGYMPDTQALRNGQLLLTLCTAGGVVSFLPVDTPDDEHAGKDVSRGDACPFGMLASHAMLAPFVPQFLPTAFARHVPADVVFATRPPLPPLGPPLGSRAPPLTLV